MIKFKHIRFLIEAYRDRLKQKGVAQIIVDYVETLSSAEKGAAIAKLMSNPNLEIDDLKVEDYRVKDLQTHLSIMDADPTSYWVTGQEHQEPGDYYRILAKWNEEGTIDIHDITTILDVLEYYNEHKRRFRTTYISKYKTFQDLEQDYIRVSMEISKTQMVRDMKMAGSKKLYDDDRWSVYEITTEEAACYYGKGTRWCTNTHIKNASEGYFDDGPLYIFIDKIEKEKYQANHNFKEFLNSGDGPFFFSDFPELIRIVKTLFGVHLNNDN